MSRTISLGVVRTKYRSYMAHVMTSELNLILRNLKTEIPINVLFEAKKFFKIVLGQKTDDAMFDNQPARSNAYAIAWDVLNTCPDLRTYTRKGADGHFLRFAKLLEKLGKLATLDKEDKKTANDLRDFFAALSRKGERESRY